MAYTNPSVTDFKNFFVRDFPYGTDIDNQVLDADITRAIADAAFNFNSSLFSTQTEYTAAYLYLTAHFLVTNLQASSQGLAGAYNWLTASKSVQGVSESYAIPERVMQNPQLASVSKTRYGAHYISMIWPRMIGQVFTVCGQTKP